jgi:hypothetical protein
MTSIQNDSKHPGDAASNFFLHMPPILTRLLNQLATLATSSYTCLLFARCAGLLDKDEGFLYGRPYDDVKEGINL